jgi:hypothetical protein
MKWLTLNHCGKRIFMIASYDEASLIEIAKYIVQNPVRKGIVPNWESYPFSRIFDHLPI